MKGVLSLLIHDESSIEEVDYMLEKLCIMWDADWVNDFECRRFLWTYLNRLNEFQGLKMSKPRNAYLNLLINECEDMDDFIELKMIHEEIRKHNKKKEDIIKTSMNIKGIKQLQVLTFNPQQLKQA